jgi:hypothetical protein
MRVLGHVLQDPTDIMLPGAMPLGNIMPDAPVVTWSPQNVLQGESTLGAMYGDPVPRAMVGWNPYFAQPSEIGPMAIQGGDVVMVPIGPAKPIDPKIDPGEKWLYAQVPFDTTGALATEGVLLPSQQAPAFDRVLSAVPISDPTPVLNPRREVKDSGLLKIITSSNLPDNFGRVQFLLYEPQVSYQVFTLTGTTVDGTGTPIANCRVIAYQSGWRYVETGTKIIAETVSDGSGAFSMLLRNIDYQLTAYKEGAPDLAGITRQDVTPVVTQTIYLRNPTTPDGPGGSAAYRPIGSPIVRRLQ